MDKIKIPKHICNECQFGSVGEDPVAFCDIYNRHWDIQNEEAYLDDNIIVKPKWCKAETVTVNETET